MAIKTFHAVPFGTKTHTLMLTQPWCELPIGTVVSPLCAGHRNYGPPATRNYRTVYVVGVGHWSMRGMEGQTITGPY